MKVLIADDHQLLVEGLCSLLAAHGIQVVGTANDGQEAAAQALRLQPDLVLMDIRMPICDGLAATRLIKARRPEQKIVMLTTSAEDDDLFEAIRSGACGYLLKSTGGPAFIEALRGLEEGTPPFSPGLAMRALRVFTNLAAEHPARRKDPRPAKQEAAGKNEDNHATVQLTDRQAEVLKLVASGLTYKEVGLKLSLSERTIRYHMSEIMYLLHAEHRSQVIAYAGRLGLDCQGKE